MRGRSKLEKDVVLEVVKHVNGFSPSPQQWLSHWHMQLAFEMLQFDWQEARWQELFSEGNRVRLLNIETATLVTQNWQDMDTRVKEEIAQEFQDTYAGAQKVLAFVIASSHWTLLSVQKPPEGSEAPGIRYRCSAKEENQASRKAAAIILSLVLGEESPALRLLAAEQRQAGLRVLYQHVPDAQLESWEHEGQRAAWPSFAAGEVAPEAIDHALDELAALSDGSEPLDLAPEALGEAYAELGLELEEGARARIEAARRDLRSLRRRFDRLFPALDADVARLPDPDDLEATLVLDALGVVAEVLALSCSDELTAKSDAIAIFERLLQDRGLTPARYLALAREHPDRVGPAVDAVRALTGAR